MAWGPVRLFVPVEYMRFRDTSQVIAVQEMGLDSGAAGLRPRPSEEGSKHLAPSWAQLRTSTVVTAPWTVNAGRLSF